MSKLAMRIAGLALLVLGQTQMPAIGQVQSMSVLAGQMALDYSRNALDADVKYNGKTLRVAGVVMRIGKYNDGQPFIMLLGTKTDDDFIRANMKSNYQSISKIKKFDKITLACTNKGKSSGELTLECTDVIYEYAGPHHYSIERNGLYGYTSQGTGEVVFFQYNGVENGRHTLVSFSYGMTHATFLFCKEDCRFVDTSDGQTFQVQKGTILEGVISDMLAGALRTSR
ncbi:hypothetical protein Cmtc_08590 [Cupriavidus sp. TKC]|uniref:OB-fold protein n=1 Tax=Cupriavidus sp. TKC TaxID=2880159 RepID=UPI0025A7C323|nr:hypothetical protein [Cupriavidus sp. TKC]GMG89639.1 hypothetical protein Cmtc_08590 [Cupriavidus sp. TKC]